MKVSTKGRYGLRAVVDLAANTDGEAVSLKNIANRQGLSESYLEQIFAPLRKAGYIKSVRGSQGGYALEKPPEQITVGEILRTLEGDLLPTDCSAVNPQIACGQGGGCATKIVWQKIANAVNNVVDSITIADLLSEQEEDNG